MGTNMNQAMENMMKNPAAIQSLLRSRDGQALMQLLTRGDNGERLQQAAQSAMKGDTSAITNLLNNVMQDPNSAALVERINRAMQK